MQKLLLKSGFIVLVFSLAGLTISAIYFLFTTGYTDFIEWIRILLGKDTNWLPFIQSKISPERYELIKKSILVFGIVCLTGLFLLFIYRKNIFLASGAVIYFIVESFKNDIAGLRALKKPEAVIFILILIFCCIRSVWLAYTLPVTYDESWIYNYFTSKSFPESFLLPSNNHKLYTAITWWFDLLPGNKTFIVRIPVIIGGLLACSIFFSFIKKYFGISIALIGMAWFSSCIPVAKYMVTGKSYIFLLLIHMLMLRVYFEILRRDQSDFRRWLILTVIITLGYLTNPVFFFGHIFSTVFFIAVNIHQNKYFTVRKIILFNLLSLPFLLPFYITDILSGSFYNLLRFAVTQKINHPNFFILCWNNNAQFQMGFNNAGLLFLFTILCASILYFSGNCKHKTLLLYAIISVIWLPFYAAIVKDDTSVHKTMYITASVAIIMSFILQYLFFKIAVQKTYYTYLIIAFVLSGNFYLYKHNTWVNWSLQLDSSAEKIGNILLQNNATHFYLSHYYYKPALEFYYKTNRRQAKIFMGVPGSVDYVKEIPDSPAPDFLIIDNDQKDKPLTPSSYKKIFSDQFITIYSR